MNVCPDCGGVFRNLPIHRGKTPDCGRNRDMVTLRRAGATFPQIGAVYGVTGELVRGIVTRLDPVLIAEQRTERQAKWARLRQEKLDAVAARTAAFRQRLEALATRTEKRCYRCHTTKPVTEFPNNQYEIDGKGDVCHVCNRANVYKHNARRKANPVEPVPEKYCPGCDQTLPGSAFARQRMAATGLQAYCRDCHSLLNAGHIAEAVRQLRRQERAS